jgi:single-stranded DNA-binding protein
MALHTQQSLSGFIASDPRESVTENGDTRFYVRVGQPHFRHEYSGSFTALEPTFHDLVAYRATAERALTRFAKADSFVAEGYVRTFQVERDGEAIEREEFVAKKIGHDLARTNYQVDRTHRSAPGSEQDVVTTQTAIVYETEAAHTGAGR